LFILIQPLHLLEAFLLLQIGPTLNQILVTVTEGFLQTSVPQGLQLPETSDSTILQPGLATGQGAKLGQGLIVVVDTLLYEQ
jgi:hypothetical protein